MYAFFISFLFHRWLLQIESWCIAQLLAWVVRIWREATSQSLWACNITSMNDDGPSGAYYAHVHKHFTGGSFHFQVFKRDSWENFMYDLQGKGKRDCWRIKLHWILTLMPNVLSTFDCSRTCDEIGARLLACRWSGYCLRQTSLWRVFRFCFSSWYHLALTACSMSRQRSHKALLFFRRKAFPLTNSCYDPNVMAFIATGLWQGLL